MTSISNQETAYVKDFFPSKGLRGTPHTKLDRVFAPVTFKPAHSAEQVKTSKWAGDITPSVLAINRRGSGLLAAIAIAVNTVSSRPDIKPVDELFAELSALNKIPQTQVDSKRRLPETLRAIGSMPSFLESGVFLRTLEAADDKNTRTSKVAEAVTRSEAVVLPLPHGLGDGIRAPRGRTMWGVVTGAVNSQEISDADPLVSEFVVAVALPNIGLIARIGVNELENEMSQNSGAFAIGPR